MIESNYSESKEYNPDGVKFFGRLYLDLNSLDSGLPPQTRVQIQLEKSSSEFVLLKHASDPENYQMKITKCNLYIPIAEVSASVFSEISSVVASKSVALHYRKTEVRVLTIPQLKRDFVSENLFCDDIPCRITFCFVNEKARKGDYTQNPFRFQRYWDVEKTSSDEILSREDRLENELKSLRALFEARFQDEDRPLKSKSGAGPSKTKNPTLLTRLRSSFGETAEETASEHSESERRDSLPPPYTDDPIPTATKRYFIRQVQLLLNGAPLDMAIFIFIILVSIVIIKLDKLFAQKGTDGFIDQINDIVTLNEKYNIA